MKRLYRNDPELGRRRLTILTTSLARGGAEAQVVLLARSFHARDWRVEVISMLPPLAHAEELVHAGIPVHSLEMRPGVPDPGAIFRLARLLRKSGPHVLHCHMAHANLLGRIVRIAVHIPVVISTAHSVREGPRWLEWGYRITDSMCDLTTNVSHTGVERYRRAGVVRPAKIAFVANGIDASAYACRVEMRSRMRAELRLNGRFVWLAVGNLREPKDYPTMLKALALLAQHPVEHTLLIAGAGVLEDKLRNLASALNLSSRLRWLGSRGDIPQLASAADAFVMSSKIEGTPMAILEAAAGGLPVVATRVGGIPDVIEDRRSGYLVNPGNPRDLANAMDRLMTIGESQRLEMGHAAQLGVVSRYGIAAVVTKWETIYDELLNSASRARRPNAATSVKRIASSLVSK